jgi:hypothetical protein
VDSIYLAEDRYKYRTAVKTVMNYLVTIKGEKCLEELGDC